MTPFGDVLEHATRVLEGAPSAGWGSLRDDELLIQLADVEQLGRLVDALRVAAAGEVDARSGREREDSLSRHHQCTTGAQLVELVTRTSSAEAARRVRVGRGITPLSTLTGAPLPAAFEQVAAAISAGRLGVDAAAAIIRHLTDASRAASPETIREAEALLVQQAATLPAEMVAQLAQRTCATLDPDGVRPREEVLRQQRRFHLGREVDGMTPFSGLADPINAGLLRAALTERTAPSRQPRFADEDDLEASPFDGRPLDGRTREQRAFDIVFGLLTAGIRTDRDTVGTLHGTATVTVVVTAKDLIAGTGAAWIDDILTPIATATTQEISCDGGIRLQIEGDNGEILYEGLRERYFTPAQRRALAVRDGGCLGPHCTAPPSWCHAHHVIEWEHGGPTDIDNGALLCSFHHHQLHSGAFHLRINHGIPELLAPPWYDRQQQWKPITRSRLTRAA